MEPIEIIIRLLVLLFLGVVTPVTVSTTIPEPTVEVMPPADVSTIPFNPQLAGADMTQRVPTVIESVDALLLESFPVQIHLQVSGYQPDGCQIETQVLQHREGNQVRVEVFRALPLDTMCPMVLVPYEATIPLEGGFESGAYTIDVNGVVIEVTV